MVGSTLLRVSRDGFIGRRLYERMAHTGDPVFSDQFERMQAAEVERVGRIADIQDGRPVTADGQAFDIENVVWATGFHPHYPWIDLDVFDETGEPRHTRGVVEEAPGLFFVGLPWQARPNSSLTGGVGPDAEYVARQVYDAVT